MEEALDDLPKSLEAMYADVLMKKIPEEYREEAKVILMWLAYSYRPLRLRELAVVASLPEQNVLHICTSSLVSLDEDVVKFDHFSVKEYLVSECHLAANATTASSFYVPPMLAHLQIAGTCISTLLDPKLVNLIERYIPPKSDLHRDFPNEWWKFDTGEDDINTIVPLLEYSQNWHLHVQKADSMTARSAQLNDPSLISESEHLRDHIHRLFRDENHLSFRYSTQVVDVWDMDTKLSPSPLYYASYWNLTDSVRRLLKVRSNPREAMSVVSTLRNELQEQMTPLHIAGIMGNLEIVRLMLDSGIRIAQSEFELVIGKNHRDGLAVLTSILETQPDLSITNDTVIAAARNLHTKDFVEYFLNNRFLSSKARLLRVLSHWRDDFRGNNTRLMKALVRHGEDIGCTGQDFFNAVIQINNAGFIPVSLLEFVLERYEPLSLSQAIAECIASDTLGGFEMLRRLCQNYKGISFSQDQLAAAAKKDTHGMHLVDIILEYDKTLQISQLVIQAAARNSFGHKIFYVLMYHNKSLEINWEILKSIAYRYDTLGEREYGYYDATEILRVLMDHEYCGLKFPGEKLPVAKAYFLMAFQHKDCKFNCSKQMLQAVARWEPDAIEYLQSNARPNVTFRKYALQEQSLASLKRTATRVRHAHLQRSSFAYNVEQPTTCHLPGLKKASIENITTVSTNAAFCKDSYLS